MKSSNQKNADDNLNLPEDVSETQRYGSAWKFIIVLIALCVPLFFFNLGDRDFWNPDEPRYGQIIKEMLETGDWVMLRVNGKPYPDKPPLFFWLAGICSLINGEVNEFTARIPSAASALLCIFVVFALGRRLFNPLASFLGAIILATNIEFLWEARWAETDMMLTLFITAALTCLYYGYTAEKKNAMWYILSYVCMGLGTLAKGPLGFLLPLLIIIVYLAWTRELKLLARMHLGIGLIIICIMVLPWLLTADLRGGSGFSKEMLIHHIIVRYFKGVNHIKPWYHYFPSVFEGFFPWSILLISAFIYAYREIRRPASLKGDISKKDSRLRHIQKRHWVFLLTWFITTFIFFTMSPTKQGVYLLPLYPAMSLLVGAAIEGSIFYVKEPIPPLPEMPLKQPSQQVRPLPKLISIPIIIMMITALLSSVAIFVSSYLNIAEIPVSQFSMRLFAVGLTLVTVMALFSHLRLRNASGQREAGRYMFTFLSLFILTIYGIQAVTQLYVLPRVDEYKSARPLCEEVLSIMKPEDGWAMFGSLEEAFVFYSGRKMEEIPAGTESEMGDLQTFFAHFEQLGKRGFCVMRLRDYERTRGYISVPLEIIAQDKVGHKNIVIVSNSNFKKQL